MPSRWIKTANSTLDWIKFVTQRDEPTVADLPQSVSTEIDQELYYLLKQENEALAALLADVVELSQTGAVYPGHLALIAEQVRAMRACGGHCGVSSEHQHQRRRLSVLR